MQIEVQYFAVLADRIGTRSESIELPEHATVSVAMETLTTRHAVLQTMAGSLATAVGDAYVSTDTVLTEGDVLAIIPPVSGG